MDLSIVMPTRNEAQRLPRTLAAIEALAAGRPWSIEVVVADDGSRDATPAVATPGRGRISVRFLPSSGPRGVGAAVRRGILAAQGERILVCDADGAVPFEEVDRFWAALDAGADLVVGSRAIDRRLIEVHQPAHRILIGRVWGFLAARLVPTQVRDTQCGFKLLRRRAAMLIFATPTVASFAFHIDMLARAQVLDLRVVELPVRWRDIAGSTIRLWRDPVCMLVDLLRIAYGATP
ncbi:MAG: glycosyltransferase [Myxococcota bacterium]